MIEVSDKVVAIRSSRNRLYKKGELFTVTRVCNKTYIEVKELREDHPDHALDYDNFEVVVISGHEVKRQQIIQEVTNACETFEKYNIKRFHHSMTGSAPVYAITGSESRTYDSIDGLCRHLSPDNSARIKALKNTIKVSKEELEALGEVYD